MSGKYGLELNLLQSLEDDSRRFDRILFALNIVGILIAICEVFLELQFKEFPKVDIQGIS